MPSAAFNLGPKLFILPFLLIVILSNLAHSDNLEEFSKKCLDLSTSLDKARGSLIETQVLPFQPLKTSVASVDTFWIGLHDEMGNFSSELSKFLETSKEYQNENPAIPDLLNKKAVKDYEKLFKQAGTETDRGTKTEMAKLLKSVFTLGRNVNANPKELGVIFAYLDGLTVNAAPNGTAAGEPFATVGLKWKSVLKFVHHLKRELIYAQSEIIIIRDLEGEFIQFTKSVFDPIKASVKEYVTEAEPQIYNSLKEEIVAYEKKVGHHNRSKNKHPIMTQLVYNNELYRELYREISEGKLEEKSEKTTVMGKMSQIRHSLFKSVHLAGSASSSSGTKKGSDKAPLLQTPQQQKVTSDIRVHNILDELAIHYMQDMPVPVEKKKNFLYEYHHYEYLYGLLKTTASVLNQKMQKIVNGLVESEPGKMANIEDEKKQVILILVEQVLKPLLNVIDSQIRQEYGHKIDEEHFMDKMILPGELSGHSASLNKMIEKSPIASRVSEKLAIPSEMLNAETAMLDSAIKSRVGEKAIRQYRMRMNAVKVLVIYERLDFFFGLFKNVKTMSLKNKEKLIDKLKGLTLPEHFGQIVFDETKKRMGEKEV